MSTTAKSLFFRAGAMLLPVLVLLILEVVLRFAGVAGDSIQPFRGVEGHEDYLMLNANYTSRYFGSFAPAVAFDPFRRQKPDSTFRVFTFGGSTTAGFPYDAHAFPALVQSRLESFLPGLRNEVVNLALTATNSYTIWDLSRDVSGLDPDAIIIYAGHNEYYGAFGAGTSVNRLGNVRWLKRLVIRLKRSVLYTMMERAFYVLRPASDVVGRTMMAEAVGNASIPMGGDVFEEGIAQFEQNLTEAVGPFCSAGVPVYLGTLASNLADQPPLGEDESAGSSYAAGATEAQAGRFEAARTLFVEARDLDDLRFRAPSEINRAVERVAGSTCATVVDVSEAFRTASPNGVEGNDLFVDHLHPNVAGHELMADSFFSVLLDHPRLRGLPRLSLEPSDPRASVLDEAAAELRIARLKLGHPFTTGFTPNEEAERFKRYLGEFVRRSAVDSIAARLVLGDVSPAAALEAAIVRARKGADTVTVLRLYRSLSRIRPFDAEQARRAVLLGVSDGRSTPLVRDISRMWMNRSGDSFFRHALSFAMLELGHVADAERLVAYEADRDSLGPASRYIRSRLLLARGDIAEARAGFARLSADLSVTPVRSPRSPDPLFRQLLGLESDDFSSLLWQGNNYRRAGRLRDAIGAYESATSQRPDDLALENNIATAYLQLGDTTEAVSRYRRILQSDSTFVEAWINLALFYARSGQIQRANEAMSRAVRLDPDNPMLQRILAGRGR